MTAAPARKPRATKAEMEARRTAVDRGHFSLLPGLRTEREVDIKRRQAMAAQSQDTRVCNSSAHGRLDPAVHLTAQPMRPGADAHEGYPSRFSGTLRWRDGREVMA